MEFVELRTAVVHMASEMSGMRHEFRTDIRRLDDRLFRMLLVQFATLAAALAALIANLVS